MFVAEIKKLPFIEFDRDCSVEMVMNIIFSASVDHLQKNFVLFQKQSDPESLTQLRVGLRRVRVALRIFKLVLPRDFRNGLKEGTRHFGRQLGIGRDLDVLLNEYLSPEKLKVKQEGALQSLRNLVEQRRQQDYVIIQQDLLDNNFQALIDQLKTLTDQSWKKGSDKDVSDLLASPVVPFASETLVSGAAHLREMDTERATLNGEGIHKLRRRVKKARYQLRFFMSICDTDTAQSMIDQLTKLQDCLGHIRDVTESRRLILHFLEYAETSDYVKIMELDAALTRVAIKEFRTNMQNFDRLWQDYMKKDGIEKTLISA